MSDEQVRIREQILNNEGSKHEVYCTLCGVLFNLYRDWQAFQVASQYLDDWDSTENPHGYDLGESQDNLVWASYFLARKQLILKSSGELSC